MRPSLSLLAMLWALSCALTANAQDLVPLPDPYIPYQ
jgi:hypothetical protein